MVTALGVSVDADDNGVTPLTHRLIIGSYFQQTGVVKGLGVSGRNDLKYDVAEGMAVVSRAAADGKMLAYWPGGSTETVVSAGDPSNPRIDVVWVKANNSPEYPSDPDNQVHVGVTQGVPAASPVVPAIPQGCTAIATRLMPAGATATQSATVYGSVDYAVPYGANLGRLAEYWDKHDFRGDSTVKKMFYEFKVSFDLPTDRLLDFDFKVSLSAADQPWESTNKRTEWSICFQLDDVDIPHSGANFVSYGAWETHQVVHTCEVSAGHHTARLRTWLQNGVPAYFHYTGDDSVGRQWVGRRFQIFDRGPVR